MVTSMGLCACLRFNLSSKLLCVQGHIDSISAYVRCRPTLVDGANDVATIICSSGTTGPSKGEHFVAYVSFVE